VEEDNATSFITCKELNSPKLKLCTLRNSILLDSLIAEMSYRPKINC